MESNKLLASESVEVEEEEGGEEEEEGEETEAERSEKSIECWQ